MESLVESLKSLETGELFKVMKTALSEAEKRSKGSKGKVKAVAAVKKGSMPKGKVPPQLRKPRAWVDFTLKHALENGWECFTIHQTKKDKETGEKMEEEIEMPGSVLHEGAHVYEGSVTEKTPSGKQLIHKDAMSLSKQRKETGHATYELFLAEYVEEEEPVSDTASDTSSKKVIRKTAAEKAAEAEAKKAEKEADKEAKKAAKEAEKEAKKAAKEAEKEAKKAAKEKEKEEKKSTKDSKTTVKAPIPVAAIKKVETPEKKPANAGAGAPTKPKKPAAKKVEEEEEWSCAADGLVHPWTFKGKHYFRNSDNEVWLKGADGGCGEWQGIYIPSEKRIDDSVEEPGFEDEE